MNPWKERYAWYWYNDEQIFRYTDADFDRDAARYAESGVTTVWTFSNTHFRWDFRPWWPKLNDVLRRIVQAFHAHGIKVVEHHSTCLTTWPQGEAEWAMTERHWFALRNSSIESWPGLRDRFTHYPEEYKPWLQIDGRTGEPARSNYRGVTMCFNNPDYRAAYMAYMKDVLATGVDGIMNDDVEYFAQSCACPHCRRLFREQTRYEMPDPEHWPAFWENYSDPVYVAFRRFRLASTAAFYSDLTAYYESLGYTNLLRPNYDSKALTPNWASYPFEAAAKSWSVIAQENYIGSVRKYSYPGFALEMLHRNALAARCGVPSMSLFYPEKEDEYYFTWALSKLWGQIYLPTKSGGGLGAFEGKYRSFEDRHERSYTAPSSRAELAVYQSAQTRDYTNDAWQYLKPFFAWMQGCYFSGFAMDMVFETDPAEILAQYPVLLVPHAAMLSDAQFLVLRSYAEGGGTLVFAGKSGIFGADGSPRPMEKVFRLLGLRSAVREETLTGSGVFLYRGRSVVVDDIRASLVFEPADGAQILLQTGGKAAAICENAGKGEILWLPDVSADAIQYEYVSDIRRPDRKPAEVPVSPIPTLRRSVGGVLKAVTGGTRLNVITDADLLASVHRTRDGLALHLFNLDGTIPDHPLLAEYNDPIPTFDGANKLPCPVTVRYELPEGMRIRTVAVSTPEGAENRSLDFTDRGGTLEFTVPAGIFGGYALIEAQV